MIALIKQLNTLLSTMPHSVTAFIARFSIAATFWKSGQTKIEGFVLDIVNGDFMLALPRLGASTPALFRDEYKLPFIDPTLAASLAAFAEHLFPVLILIGFATRLSSVALLVMTLTIQLLVYPGAYATHGVWAAVLLMLIAKGAGTFSIDHILGHKISATSIKAR
jgi:putative oxidoreductase